MPAQAPFPALSPFVQAIPRKPQSALFPLCAPQAVDLALRSLASPGSTVLLPEPIYPAILSICAAAGLQVRGYRVGADDSDLTDLTCALELGKAAAIYTQPTFSNPGGQTWDLTLRARFLQLCAEHHVPVVEDDPCRGLYTARRGRQVGVLAAAGFNGAPAAGGMFLFPALPKGARVEGLFDRALAQNVPYVLGKTFALDRSRPRFETHLRLCFAGLDAETLGIAAARLVAELKD